MKIPRILPSLSLRLPSFAWAALLFTTGFAPFSGAAETAETTQPPPALAPAPALAAAKPAEDRDALLARLTKVLKYGSQLNGYRKPGKAEAALALGLIGDERSVPVLVEHLQNEENDHLRLQIVRALGWIGSAQAVPALEQALQDRYPHVRRQAAEVLKQLTDRSYEYDKTDLPSLSDLDASTASDTRRLEQIADEVKKRREIRQMASGGTASPEKKKMAEPVDIILANQPARLVVKTYSDLTGKLVLVSPKISATVITCKIEKATLADAQAAMNKALLEAGVLVVELERGVIAFTPADSAKPADKLLKP